MNRDGRARLPPSRAPTRQTRGRPSRHRPPNRSRHRPPSAFPSAPAEPPPANHSARETRQTARKGTVPQDTPQMTRRFLSFPSSCLGTHRLRSSGFAPLPKHSFGDPRFSVRRLHRRARCPGVPALGWSRGTGPPDSRSELLVPCRAPSTPPPPASQAKSEEGTMQT